MIGKYRKIMDSVFKSKLDEKDNDETKQNKFEDAKNEVLSPLYDLVFSLSIMGFLFLFLVIPAVVNGASTAIPIFIFTGLGLLISALIVDLVWLILLIKTKNPYKSN